MKQPPARPGSILLFGAALALALWLVAVFLMNPDYQNVLWMEIDRIAILAWAVLILTAAISFGAMVLRRLNLRPAGHMATALFGAGIGLGAISLVTLLLGVAGFIGRARLLVAILALLFFGLWDLGTLLRMAAVALKQSRKAGAFRMALWGVLGFFLLLNVTRAFDPPFDYDSLEYHLAAPTAYHEAGRVHFMRDNVYANFPQNVEMLYLAAFELTGSRYRGTQLGQLLGGLMGFMAALALRGMLRGIAGKEAGDIGAAVFYVWPGVTVYSGVAYVELPLIFYATLAFWALLWSWRRKRTRPKPRGWIILSGIATGLALGVKLTAALLLFVPILFWLAVLSLRQRLPLKEIARRGVTFAAVAMICFSPWLLRSFINTRNPVYPLLYGVFGGSNWDAQKDARWTREHSPRDTSLSTLALQGRDVLFFNENKVSLMMLMFAPFALLARRREREAAIWLALNTLLLFGLWFFFTQQNARFLEAGITVPIALAAIGARRLTAFGGGPIRVIIVLLLLLAPTQWVNYLNAERSLGVALGKDSRDDYFRKDAQDFQAGYAAMQFVNGLPSTAKVLFIGEARTFYCERSHIAATVFDTQPAEALFKDAFGPAEVRDRMQQQGITHLYIDTAELGRLQKSYSFAYGGRQHLGMLDGFDWALFDRFIREQTQLVWSLPPQGVENMPWARWPDLLSSADRPPAAIAIYEVR